MVLSTRLEPPDLMTATLRGMVTRSDHADVVDAIRAATTSLGSIRVLIVFETFGGWVADASNFSATSWLGEDDKLSQVALVGRPEWRRSVLTLISHRSRRLPIRYFETDIAARRWLGVEPQDDARAVPM